MFRLGKPKVAKEKCYGANKPREIWDVNADNIVISKLVEIKTTVSV